MSDGEINLSFNRIGMMEMERYFNNILAFIVSVGPFNR